jgi:hypothetical protein
MNNEDGNPKAALVCQRHCAESTLKGSIQINTVVDPTTGKGVSEEKKTTKGKRKEEKKKKKKRHRYMAVA